MDIKTKLTRQLRSAVSDNCSLNGRINKWCRCFREVEKLLNCSRPGRKDSKE